jgi:hypothetical protein
LTVIHAACANSPTSMLPLIISKMTILIFFVESISIITECKSVLLKTEKNKVSNLENYYVLSIVSRFHETIVKLYGRMINTPKD